MFEQDSHSSNSSKEDITSNASVEIWVTFFTTPQYVGLLRAKDADFLQEQSDLVLNDDLMEDLIRVCSIAEGSPNVHEK